MPVTPTIENTWPTVGSSADTWGSTLNDRGGETYVDINALADLLNAVEALANGALPKAGGTTTGDIALADVAAASVRSVGFRGAPVIDFDADRTLAATDAGKMLRLTGATARTLTIPNVGAVGFQKGTVIVLRVFGSQPLAISRGSGVQLRLSGSTTDKNCAVASQGLASLTMEDPNVWVLSGNGVS